MTNLTKKEYLEVRPFFYWTDASDEDLQKLSRFLKKICEEEDEDFFALMDYLNTFEAQVNNDLDKLVDYLDCRYKVMYVVKQSTIIAIL